MLLFPSAKINLGLHILGKRDDGYHDIDSVLYPISLSDAIEGDFFSRKESFFIYNSDFDLDYKKNLAYKAWLLLKEKFDIPEIELHLLKNIPSQAGLGGASADAVAVLKICNKLLHMDLSVNELEYYASMLGSDCPFFVRNTPAVVSGRGEILQHINDFFLKGYYVQIVKKHILSDGSQGISTARAYSESIPDSSRKPIIEILQQPIDEWKYLLVNDFQQYAIKNYPEIGKIITDMYDSGAVYAAMTGSGSACFGIYKQKPENETFSGNDFFVFDSKF